MTDQQHNGRAIALATLELHARDGEMPAGVTGGDRQFAIQAVAALRLALRLAPEITPEKAGQVAAATIDFGDAEGGYEVIDVAAL